MTALLTLRDISVTRAGRLILRKVSLEVLAGRHMIMHGEIGAGKSTLVKIMTGEAWPDRAHGSRMYSFTPNSTVESPLVAKQHCRRFAPEMQERFVRLERDLTAYDVISSGYDNVDYPAVRQGLPVDARIRNFAIALKIEHTLGRAARDLSHGTLRRVLLARACIARPALLALDEVFDGLDAAALRRSYDFLESLAAGGTTIITIAHRLETVPEFMRADTYVVEAASVRRPSQAEINMFARAHAVPDERDGTDMTFAQSNARFDASDAVPAASPAAGEALVSSASRGAGPSAEVQVQDGEATPIVTFAGVIVAAAGDHLITDVTWSIKPRESWWLKGANGAGKSTLLETITGLQLPAGGRVSYLGQARRFSVRELQEHIALLSDRWQARYDWGIPVRDVIASGWNGSIGYFSKGTPEQEQRVAALLAEFDLTPLASRSMRDLSFGQRRLVLFARALVREPKLLLMDESFDGLDTQHAQQLVDALTRRFRRGLSLIVASHQPLVRGLPCTGILRIADRRAVAATQAAPG